MLSLRFHNNISDLMKTMETTAPQFIRCVKSNECKKPFYFNAKKTFNQLQYLGVLDSIRIRHDGFSYQTNYKEVSISKANAVPQNVAIVTVIFIS